MVVVNNLNEKSVLLSTGVQPRWLIQWASLDDRGWQLLLVVMTNLLGSHNDSHKTTCNKSKISQSNISSSSLRTVDFSWLVPSSFVWFTIHHDYYWALSFLLHFSFDSIFTIMRDYFWFPIHCKTELKPKSTILNHNYITIITRHYEPLSSNFNCCFSCFTIISWTLLK